MMLRPLLFALVLLPLAVLAQNTAPQTVRPAPAAVQRLQPVQPAPVAVAPDPSAGQVNTDVVDPQGTIDTLRENNRRLKADNAKLKDDVARLDARIAEFTRRGGSEVRAYCEAPNTSRNTAGAKQSCGSFACNDVSGLCYERCTLTEHCAVGACHDGICLTQAPSSDD